MAQRRSGSGRVTGQLAEMYGRSDAEIRLLFGVAVAASGVVLALRTYQVLDDLDLLHPSRRDAPAHGAPFAGLHRAWHRSQPHS